VGESPTRPTEIPGQISAEIDIFMFYIGGNFRNSNTELHDVRFSVGETIRDCYQDLRAHWWGDPKNLHLDCWGEVAQADGYDVVLLEEASATVEDRSFFINPGGYSPDQFAEMHRNILVVASNEIAAKARALEMIDGWSSPHKNRLFDVEKILDVGAAVQRAGCFVRLTKAAVESPFTFECGYLPIV
jgi:Domain of Unknown Function (DUF1543)